MLGVELTWYKALVLIASGLAIGVGIASMVYFNKIRLEGQCGPVSTGTANTMLWLNLILVIFAAIVFLWSLFRLIFTGHDDKVLVNHEYNLHSHIHSEPDVLPVGSPVVPVTNVPAVPVYPSYTSSSYVIPGPQNSPGVLNMNSFTV